MNTEDFFYGNFAKFETYFEGVGKCILSDSGDVKALTINAHKMNKNNFMTVLRKCLKTELWIKTDKTS